MVPPSVAPLLASAAPAALAVPATQAQRNIRNPGLRHLSAEYHPTPPRLSAEEASVLLGLVAYMLPAAHFAAAQIECWQRFMRGVSGCILLMYARVPVTSLIFLGRAPAREPEVARLQSQQILMG